MERVFDELAKVPLSRCENRLNVDAVCIYMVECPERFDVIVTSNIFGEITDLMTQGGMGVNLFFFLKMLHICWISL